MAVNDFQAVILAAGRGSRMTELTTGRPKCLLPVGGKPLIYHPLKILEKTGFEDVIILVLEASYSQVQNALSQLDLKINTDVISIPPDLSEDWGTADSLRFLVTQEKIKTDVVLVSCDLFTNASLHKLMHTYRKHKSSFSALLFLPQNEVAIQVPGAKSKYKPEKDIVGIDSETSRLMFLASASDFEEQVKINRSILRRHPKLSIRTDLIDGHLYILSAKLAKYLAIETSFSTLKGEFFPYVVSKQHVRPAASNEESSIVNESTKKSLYEFVKESKLEEDIKDLSTYTDHRGDLQKVYHGDVLRCYAVIADSKDFGIRVNSLQALCQANRIVSLRKENDAGESRIDPSAQIESNQIDNESFIAPGAIIKEKTSIKSSTIGEACIVHPKTRITQCIIFKGVEINEGCTLENSIICDNTVVGKNCSLKNCIVEANFTVPDETKANCQVLTRSERLMEI